MKTISFKLGELFCGPGGLAYGASQAKATNDAHNYRIEPVWANDKDEDSCRTYAKNIHKLDWDSSEDAKQKVVCRDVNRFDYKNRQSIDGFAYGFPCNDFSIVGERKGLSGKYGPLYAKGVEIIDHFKPTFFVAENVGGIRSSHDGFALHSILKALKNSGDGYQLTTHLYKFEDYGVPQARHRIIIVGIQKQLGLTFQVPAPTTANKPISAREALRRPIPKSAANQELTKQSRIVVERLKYIKPGQNAWDAALPSHLKLRVKNAHLSQIYKRLDPDRPAYTITGSGGGGTHCYHWIKPRALTNRERARLQTFPDEYSFSGSKESVRKQIGMAVSPLMSEIIFTSILRTLAGINYRTVKPNYNLNAVRS